MSALSRSLSQPLSRRQLLWSALWGGGACAFGLGLAQAATEPRVIAMTARRFVFEPSEIELKVGERVIIAIHSLDFVHGMNLPDLGKRLDLVPGKITQLELQPMAPGVIEFLCDNFCGDGHENMHGRFIVSA
ncbi:MAG: cupredoxin domain-containing protein [Burkholderiaceae bacterium]|nr:cupredoxin domain-containing protein [Roseateles sp.]MBV8469011.1 cupredoxin domain-containing protein [Burkholderiaceae bacterium]